MNFSSLWAYISNVSKYMTTYETTTKKHIKIFAELKFVNLNCF